jgi:hypothetical protein
MSARTSTALSNADSALLTDGSTNARNIGGAIGLSGYAALSTLHQSVIAAEVRRLHRSGLLPHDISNALGVHVEVVLNHIAAGGSVL